ncbi:MAG: acyl-CoA dehydrogenase family protein [Rhodospirillaceae bacterium]|nr:acyl-CoA dehydrogenase family protein [Rhodospirillaceae bacterium]
MTVIRTLERSAQATLTEADLIRRGEALLPFLAENAARTEAARMVPTDVMAEVFRAGLLRYFQPKRFGGYDMDWGAQIRLGRVIARACASTAWLVCVIGSHAAYVARMAPRAQDDVWGSNRDVLIATGSVPRGVRITRTNGGFLLNGKWGFCSGVDHAHWALTRGIPEGEDGGGQYYFLYPRDEFTIEDDWYVAGLSGSGSKTIVAKDVFIPDYRAMKLTELMSPNPPGGVVNRGFVYNYNFRPFAGTALLGPILGAAEAALECYVTGLSAAHQDDAMMQLRLSESAAEISTAALIVESLIDRLRTYAGQNRDIPKDERITLVRDKTYTARLCFRAVERLVSGLDAASILGEAPIQRHYRDLSAMVQQIGVNWDRNMTNTAKAMFGAKTDIPFLNV